MKEREILRHHVELIRRVIGDSTEDGEITAKIGAHVKKHFSPKLYPFNRERPMEGYILTMNDSAKAIISNNFRGIKEIFNKDQKLIIFDDMCLVCPNHDVVKSTCELPFENIINREKMTKKIDEKMRELFEKDHEGKIREMLELLRNKDTKVV
jgi:hypothetical protein